MIIPYTLQTFSDHSALICGGYAGQALEDMFRTFNGEMRMELIEPRCNAASVMIDNKIWIVGGRKGAEDLETSEFIFDYKAPELGPTLPFSISNHGMVQYDDSKIYLIGGFQNGVRSKKTWIMNPKDNFKLTKGPELNESRTQHSCGKMKVNGKMVLVVAGGYHKSSQVWGNQKLIYIQ